jgi:formylglycine-generating enzyme required for sulfatase activity
MAATQALDAPHTGMAWVPEGTFRMGSEDFYPEERPVLPRPHSLVNGPTTIDGTGQEAR